MSDFIWIGNHPAADLCNTQPVVAGESVDLLPDFDALTRWVGSSQVGLPVGTLAAAAATETLQFVRQLRNLIRPILESTEPDATQIDALNELLSTQIVSVAIDRAAAGGTSLTAPDPAGQFRCDLVTATADIFTFPPERVRKCTNPDCVLLFLDRSKGGHRRWCDMATCGNRAKVSAHAKRTQSREQH